MKAVEMFTWRLDARKSYLLLACAGLALAGGIMAFPLSYVTKTNVLIGFCLFPFALAMQGRQRFNYFYLTFIAVFGILAYAYNVRIFYFFTLGFYLLFLLEWSVGKAGILVVFLLGFMSPFFEQVAVIIGFPLRLQLSQWAGNLLSIAALDVQVEGNMMVLNGTAFTVDEACMGLHLLSISMLMGVFILAHWYRKTKRVLPWMSVSIFFFVVFLLNIVSNLFRIVILVAFRIMPEDPMHEAIGILCLIVYIMVPIYFLSQWMIGRWGRPRHKPTGMQPLKMWPKITLATVAIIMAYLGFQVQQERIQSGVAHAKVSLNNFQPVKMNNGITKMFDEQILVYIKPIPEFFTGEHTPLICWKGSGYHFEGIKKSSISGHELYTGTLAKPGAKLYTAWWYDNGKVKTIDQMNWRLRMLKGEPDFCLVNITAEDEQTLHEKLKSIFEDRLLTIH